MVGTSDTSAYLEVVIPYLSSPDLTDISGDGILQIYGAVTAQVLITAHNEAGELQTEFGDDVYFLHVENVCYVTDNYRCDASLINSEYTELPIV